MNRASFIVLLLYVDHTHAACRTKTARTTPLIVTQFAVPVGVPVAPLAPYWYAYSQYSRQPSAISHQLNQSPAIPPLTTYHSPLTLHCAKCHSGSNAKSGLDLSDLSTLDSVTRLKAIRMVLQEKMPPAPASKLTPEEVGRLFEELTNSD